MFTGVNKKLERAAYCLDNLKAMAKDSGGFAHIKQGQAMRANLDCFFFEVMSAKDFFLQAINDGYANLPKDEATQIDKLKRCLRCLKHANVLKAVESIEKELSNKTSWLWRLNNYRNSATHRELLHLAHEASTSVKGVKTYLFADPEDPSKGNADIEVIPYCEQSLARMRGFLEELYTKLTHTA